LATNGRESLMKLYVDTMSKQVTVSREAVAFPGVQPD
jgi:hypothetical protein